ncbi:hypothetical protein CgunFtcFv8_001486 [Champsocephalus gunnari]|uniref:Uncharacterized protein n=1 Tax=Champsocephalus gunnari TaxID=52237 RepID=A0AAN8CKL0_CHAGU|nr:hypothetical protein CgunFtcFv8_001486 [Champsocephalus gunnari]
MCMFNINQNKCIHPSKNPTLHQLKTFDGSAINVNPAKNRRHWIPVSVILSYSSRKGGGSRCLLITLGLSQAIQISDGLPLR